MKPSPIRDLKLLQEGLSRLLARPGMFLGLTALSTALAALGPLLRLLVSLPSDPAADGLLYQVSLMPMALYVLPRMSAFLDADTLDHPDNPKSVWGDTFETRWWRSTASRLMLQAVSGLGLLLCLFPGLLLLLIFGFGPTRTLLRGDGVRKGFESSARMMIRAWPRAVLVVGVAALFHLFLLILIANKLPDPALPMVCLRSPWFWGRAFITGFWSVWFTSVALALFQTLEADAATVPAPDQPPDSPSGK